MSVVKIDVPVYYPNHRMDDNDLNNGLLYSIYTYAIPEKDIDTDDMFMNEIVDVQWFETPQERDKNLINNKGEEKKLHFFFGILLTMYYL